MTDHRDAQAATGRWLKKNAGRLQNADSVRDLAALTEELNAHLQADGVVPVALPCGCCVLLGVEFAPVVTPFGTFCDVRPILKTPRRKLN